MNMISQLRQRIRKDETANLSVEEFNQLQGEWITRCMDKDTANTEFGRGVVTALGHILDNGEAIPEEELQRIAVQLIQQNTEN